MSALAGFCYAETADNRAYLIVAIRKTTRTAEEIERRKAVFYMSIRLRDSNVAYLEYLSPM
jgi:hypothetical protein